MYRNSSLIQFTDDALKQEVDPQSPIETDSHMSPNHDNSVEYNEESKDTDEKESESQEMDYMQVNKFKVTFNVATI